MKKDAWIMKDRLIVFAETASVKSEPKITATDAFVLHEGTKVYILESIANWKKVELTDEYYRLD